jgi:hypothetical protein
MVRLPFLAAIAALGVACAQGSDLEGDVPAAEGGAAPAAGGGGSEPSEGGSAPSAGGGGLGDGGDAGQGGTPMGGAGGTGGSGGTGGAGGSAPSCTPLGLVAAPASCASLGITVATPYDSFYSCYDLGPAPGVPTNFGGLTTTLADENTLLIGGSANTAAGNLYNVTIDRDANCHILGFTGASSTAVTAPYNDGGVSYHPSSNVLFLARWPVNEVGMVGPASATTDKVVPMSSYGFASSVSALNFVPAGFSAADQLKLVTWPTGEWYSVSYAPDGMGLFDITGVAYVTTIAGGPEGFTYVPAGSPLFPSDGLLVSEYSAGKIATYGLDANDDPSVMTRADFVTGLTGAEGALLDPLSGDFLFSTFGGSNRVIAIRGFLPPHK